MTKPKIGDKEIRVFTADMEVRSDEDSGEEKIVGYALKFNRWSKDLGWDGWFKECIDRNALEKTDTSDCVLLINHDSNYPVGRVGKNLRLMVDDIGLKFECTPPQTTYANDLLVNMRAGILNQCSFAFTVADEGEEWQHDDENDIYTRKITNIDKLYDVSVVTTPAYADTEVVLSQRCLDEVNHHKEEKEKELDAEKYERELLALQVEVCQLGTVK